MRAAPGKEHTNTLTNSNNDEDKYYFFQTTNGFQVSGFRGDILYHTGSLHSNWVSWLEMGQTIL